MKKPKLDLDAAPFCVPGMGVEAAYHNGYKHGYQGVVTTGICTLVKDTDEYKAWHRGYVDGEQDAKD